MTLKALNNNGTGLTKGLLLNALIIRDSSGKLLGEIRGSTNCSFSSSVPVSTAGSSNHGM